MKHIGYLTFAVLVSGMASSVMAQPADAQARAQQRSDDASNSRAQRASEARLAGRVGSAPTPPIKNMPWVLAPSVQDVEAARPKGVTGVGRSTLRCSFKGNGTPMNCRPLRRDKGNEAFDAAAISLISKFAAQTNLGPDINIRDLQAEITVAFSPTGEQPKPVFFAKPTTDQYMDALATANLVDDFSSGQVLMTCDVIAGGKLSNCAIAQEAPNGQGLGAAALRLSRFFGVHIWNPEGVAVVGSQVQVPIKFALN